jgi:uncharacterized membrane protein YGL010W
VKSLTDQLAAYAAYHSDARNALTHFVGVPLVTFSLFLFLGWLRFWYYPEMPFASGATLFFVLVFIYYLCLDWKIALGVAPASLALLWLSDWIARGTLSESLYVFLATFVGGWIIQLIGHAMEGKRPALTDNLMQIFNAPLFLTAEVALLLGMRDDLRQAASHQASLPLANRMSQPQENGTSPMSISGQPTTTSPNAVSS